MRWGGISLTNFFTLEGNRNAFKILVCLLSGFFFAGAALADTKLGTDEAAVKAAIEKKFPDIKIDSLQKTQYGGLYEAVMEGSQIFTPTKMPVSFWSAT